MNNVLKNIRKNNTNKAIKMFFPTVIFTFMFCFLIYLRVDEEEEFNVGYLIMILSVALFAILCIIAFIKSIILIIKPLKADIFKKYGSLQKIEKIVNEIEKTKIYEDKHLIISENYLSDKTDYSKIVLCADVLGVHKLVHSTNGRIDYYKIVITDKYNETMTYLYGEKEENLVDQLIVIIGSKCPNAEIGYNKKEWENIKKNSIKLPKESKKEKKKKIEEEKYTSICSNCGTKVKDSDTKCPQCGESFNEEEIENENETTIDQKYNDLTKLKELLDKNIISKEEFEKEKKKVLDSK